MSSPEVERCPRRTELYRNFLYRNWAGNKHHGRAIHLILDVSHRRQYNIISRSYSFPRRRNSPGTSTPSVVLRASPGTLIPSIHLTSVYLVLFRCHKLTFQSNTPKLLLSYLIHLYFLDYLNHRFVLRTTHAFVWELDYVLFPYMKSTCIVVRIHQRSIWGSIK